MHFFSPSNHSNYNVLKGYYGISTHICQKARQQPVPGRALLSEVKAGNRETLSNAFSELFKFTVLASSLCIKQLQLFIAVSWKQTQYQHLYSGVGDHLTSRLTFPVALSSFCSPGRLRIA